MLECMRDPEDVLEYIDDGVKKFHVRRLLEWLQRFDDDEANRALVIEVRGSIPDLDIHTNTHTYI